MAIAAVREETDKKRTKVESAGRLSGMVCFGIFNPSDDVPMLGHDSVRRFAAGTVNVPAGKNGGGKTHSSRPSPVKLCLLTACCGYSGNKCSEWHIIADMVGRELFDLFPGRCTPLADGGAPVRGVRGLGVSGYDARVSFTLCRSEILGLGGPFGTARSDVLIPARIKNVTLPHLNAFAGLRGIVDNARRTRATRCLLQHVRPNYWRPGLRVAPPFGGNQQKGAPPQWPVTQSR